jgi:hypothetical protein
MDNTDNQVPVYLAGRIREERLRFGMIDSTVDEVEVGQNALPEASFTCKEIDFRFTGPFTRSCDHKCSHIGMGQGGYGTRSHGAGMLGCAEETTIADKLANNVFKRCKLGIVEAEIVFAWIDDYEAFGTLWELGFAAGLDKMIVIGCPFDFPNASELWFPMRSATWAINESSPGKAFELFCEQLLSARDVLST